MSDRLSLPGVTLCAATSINLEATVSALAECLAKADFGDAILFTDQPVDRTPAGLRLVKIDNLAEAPAYSDFMLRGLIHHVGTDHVLIAQWDGFILSADAWEERFLDFDYIGAVWPQFSDGAEVGNGGFSLRSRRLLEACLDPQFVAGHPEDVSICRNNRNLLETKHNICFADVTTARRFAFERERPNGPTFGFHGVFNMRAALGSEKFWEIYRSLEDRRSVFHDGFAIAASLGPKRGSALLGDLLRFKLGA